MRDLLAVFLGEYDGHFPRLLGFELRSGLGLGLVRGFGKDFDFLAFVEADVAVHDGSFS